MTSTRCLGRQRRAGCGSGVVVFGQSGENGSNGVLAPKMRLVHAYSVNPYRENIVTFGHLLAGYDVACERF